MTSGKRYVKDLDLEHDIATTWFRLEDRHATHTAVTVPHCRSSSLPHSSAPPRDSSWGISVIEVGVQQWSQVINFDLVLIQGEETTWEVAAFSQTTASWDVSLLRQSEPQRVKKWSHGPCAVQEVSQSTWSTLKFNILKFPVPTSSPKTEKRLAKGAIHPSKLTFWTPKMGGLFVDVFPFPIFGGIFRFHQNAFRGNFR